MRRLMQTIANNFQARQKKTIHRKAAKASRIFALLAKEWKDNNVITEQPIYLQAAKATSREERARRGIAMP